VRLDPKENHLGLLCYFPIRKKLTSHLLLKSMGFYWVVVAEEELSVCLLADRLS
jgi:hypothetical protein